MLKEPDRTGLRKHWADLVTKILWFLNAAPAAFNLHWERWARFLVFSSMTFTNEYTKRLPIVAAMQKFEYFPADSGLHTNCNNRMKMRFWTAEVRGQSRT
jgi:hypothetical protein